MRIPKFLSRADGSQDHYELLPTNATFVPFRRVVYATTTRRRIFLVCAFCIPFLLCFGLYTGLSAIRIAWANLKAGTGPKPVLPPTFDRFYDIERSYPQHNASLPPPEGENGRFVWVSNQHFGLGWNNIFQPLYMTAHVAYLSNRAYVFEPYTWNRGPEPYDTYNGHLIPSRIPLSALVDGPIAGGPFPSDQPNPRSVSVEFFNQICPDSRRTKISIEEMNEGLQGRPVIEIVEKYATKLRGMSGSCVELYGGNDHIFDWMQFGDAGMESAWPTLSKSPILKEFKWAPLVLAALRTNAADVAPALSAEPPPDLVPDLMAVHIRRGDYEQHCWHLANWSASYMGWCQTPGLSDPFVPPPGAGWGTNTPENIVEFMRHCYPEIPQVVRRIQEVRYEWENRADREARETRLKRLYILTNGKREWVKELKHALEAEGDWDVIFSSRDMSLSFEQTYIAQAIDMAIAQRAAVLIGTGFSSLTANTILLRRIHELPLHSNHFW